ncbi:MULTISPECIES: acyl-CoA dehydrogenase [Paraburkholderia]|jgi:acyl-CoA dehydrogenase|uniref:acyl-CoA dehydrogenase n=1 Tax=Paraburkholderia TaxID=1822464 RepID=UPI0038BCEDAA
MSEYTAPWRDMRFILREVIAGDAIKHLPAFEEVNDELLVAILDQAGRFATEVLAPLDEIGDREGCALHDGQVRTPTGWKNAYKAFCDAGWASFSMPVVYGGQGLPKVLAAPVTEMWFSANMAFSLMPPMAVGSVQALDHAASQEIKEMYLPRMASGEWTATMDLTEPSAGSDLGAIKTRAEIQPDGTYRLFGQKIFITYGDHDLAENVVHLVLARIDGAPQGVRGVSMFVVPKYLPASHGSLGSLNDMKCIAIEHKLGIRGSPTCTMSYGDEDGAVGFLVGVAGRGLEYMFTVVNESRFNVGLQGIAQAEKAFQKALEYSKERRQGRDPVTGEQNVPIARHPDVKRMLLLMRAYVMASRMLVYTAAASFDIANGHPDACVSQKHSALVELLMPVVKGWGSEIGIEVAQLGIQIHGGMGFIEETGAAQILRDVRITSIYEGTTGIQANDLVLRKIIRDKGASLGILIEECRIAAVECRQQIPDLPFSDELERLVFLLERCRDWVIERAEISVSDVLSGAVALLRMVGIICGAWQLTRASSVAYRLLKTEADDASYLRGIIELTAFYFCHVVPQADLNAQTLLKGGNGVTGFDETAL